MGTVGVRGSFKLGERAPLPWDAQIARAVAIERIGAKSGLMPHSAKAIRRVIESGEVDSEAGFRSFLVEIFGQDHKAEVDAAVRLVSDRVRCPLCKVPLGEARGEAPQVVHRDDGIWVCSDCFDCSTDGGYTTTRRQAAGVSAFGGGAFAIDSRTIAAITPPASKPISDPDDRRPQALPDAEVLKPFERRCIAIAELVLFCEGSTDVALRGESRASEWHVPEIYRPSIRIEASSEGMVRAIATGVTTGWAVEMKAPIPYSYETVGTLLRGLLIALCWAVDVKRAGLTSGAKGLALPNGVRAVELGHLAVPATEEEVAASADIDTRECQTTHGARAFLFREGFPQARITPDVVELLRFLVIREGMSAEGAKKRLEKMNETQFKMKLAQIRSISPYEALWSPSAYEPGFPGGMMQQALTSALDKEFAAPLKVKVANPEAKGGRIHLTSTVEVDGLDIVRLILGGRIQLKDSIDTEREPGKVAVRSSSAIVVGPPWLDEWIGEPSKDDQVAAGSSVVIGGDP